MEFTRNQRIAASVLGIVLGAGVLGCTQPPRMPSTDGKPSPLPDKGPVKTVLPGGKFDISLIVYSDEAMPVKITYEVTNEKGDLGVDQDGQPFPKVVDTVLPSDTKQITKTMNFINGRVITVKVAAIGTKGVLMGCKILQNGVEVVPAGLFNASGRIICMYTTRGPQAK
jgi:hypothetical protein